MCLWRISEAECLGRSWTIPKDAQKPGDARSKSGKYIGFSEKYRKKKIVLPDGFYISTPVGRYNPDWAIAFYEGTVKHIYFVAEIKGSMQLRDIKKAKIHCAREHFKAICGL